MKTSTSRRCVLIVVGLLAGPRVGAGQACGPADFDPRNGLASTSVMVPAGDYRLHALVCGEGTPVVYVHGQPTSTFLWREVVPAAAGSGRAVVVDLLGFGRSDQPAIEYAMEAQEIAFDAFMDQIVDEPAVLVVHDWGSYLGLRWARLNPERVAGVVLIESILPTGFGRTGDEQGPGRRADEVVATITAMAGRGPEGPLPDDEVSEIALTRFLPLGTRRTLTTDQLAAYRAPFETPNGPAAAAGLPRQIPRRSVADEIIAYTEWLVSSGIPKLAIMATPGVLGSARQRAWIQENLSNTRLVDIGEGYHFIQEDHGLEIGREIRTFLRVLIEGIGGPHPDTPIRR